MVKMLGGLAEPSVGYFQKKHPFFGNPTQNYAYEPEKAKKLLGEAGHAGKPVKVSAMISASGSGQMLPLPMNELLQQQLAACGFEVTFEVVEWNLVLSAWRNGPTHKDSRGADALNISSPSMDVATMARYLLSANGSPNGANWGHFRSEAYDRIIGAVEKNPDPEATEEGRRRRAPDHRRRGAVPLRGPRPQPARDVDEREGLHPGAELVPGPREGVDGEVTPRAAQRHLRSGWHKIGAIWQDRRNAE